MPALHKINQAEPLNTFINLLNWSEVWAPLIPLFIFIFKRPKEKHLELIAGYLLIALCINTVIDISWLLRPCMPPMLLNNNFLYNINSIIRVIFFILFFKKAVRPANGHLFSRFLIFYSLVFAIYFLVNQNFSKLSSVLHSTESLILLFCCISYFIRLINSDELFLAFDPNLLIISGLAIYESVNFFVFLFYEYLSTHNTGFAHYIWYVSNIIFITFTLLIAKAFYGRFKKPL